ncbi:hypothetical protein GHT06_011637 [Daphnia sinensis]|uniref:Maspardin n=1 Tax=Daphnia sinensis TaxID=1820382 RepID=A0AAD5PVF4_9CRUS|nr:hypothetical protein GHT06_011637 [Daphnia sinensis]
METDMSLEYLSFRSNIPCRKIVLDDSEKVWTIYDGGPKTIRSPLICLPPVSGTADTFFQQVLGLSAKGYRVISLSWPVYWSVNEWCEGFRKLLDFLQLDQVHLFGASLGGFLAQKFAEYTHRCPRVLSLILCNSFTDTSVFQYSDSAPFLWMLPSMVLKKMVMGNFGGEKMMESVVADSVDFMVERLESLSQAELASRLTLNCGSSYVHVDKLQQYCITIIDVFDDCAIASPVSEDMYRSYPHASMAHLKNGGNFPYLSRCDEVNLHLQVHLLRFERTRCKAGGSNFSD